MAIIYSTVFDEFRRKANNNSIDEYLTSLFRLYRPKDMNKNKENLLSIYLNATEDVSKVPLFLTKGFLIQADKIEKTVLLDHIVLDFIKQNNIKGLVSSLPKKQNPCYALLCLPTKYRLDLFNLSYQPSYMFFNNKTHIVHDMFLEGKVNCKNNDEFYKIIDDIKHILKTIHSNKGIVDEHIEQLTNHRTVSHFINQIANFRFSSGNLYNKTNPDLSKFIDSFIVHSHFTLPYDDKGVDKSMTLSKSILSSMKMDILLPTHKTTKTNNNKI